MLSEGEIVINKLAQGKLSVEDGLQWFKSSDPSELRSILSWISFYLYQAHPDQQLIDESIDKIPLKQTMTPIVLFKTHPYKAAAIKVCDLPEYELEQGFITLITLFKYADQRRRDHFCRNGCSHRWHNLDNNNNEPKTSMLQRIKNWFR